jgi:hypothetical protein
LAPRNYEPRAEKLVHANVVQLWPVPSSHCPASSSPPSLRSGPSQRPRTVKRPSHVPQ